MNEALKGMRNALEYDISAFQDTIDDIKRAQAVDADEEMLLDRVQGYLKAMLRDLNAKLGDRPVS